MLWKDDKTNTSLQTHRHLVIKNICFPPMYLNNYWSIIKRYKGTWSSHFFCLFVLSRGPTNNLSNLRLWALQAGLEEQVWYPSANLEESWGRGVGGSLAILPMLKPLALMPGIWPVCYSMSTIYLKTTAETLVGEGGLLNECAELSRKSSFQLQLGLVLLKRSLID